MSSQNSLRRRQFSVAWLVVPALAAVVYFVAIGGGDADRAQKAAANEHVAAVSACQKAITRAARNPSAAVIPYKKGSPVRGGWVFDWGFGDGLMLQNGFGASTQSSARCAFVDGQVAELIVEGNSII